MARINLAAMTIPQLVDRFVEIGVAQDDALLFGETRKFNRLYDQREAVTSELKARDGDARSALLTLYDHPNMQVRLNAVKDTLAIAPERGRQTLEVIYTSKCYPQAMDAGMCLSNLDEGIFKPT